MLSELELRFSRNDLQFLCALGNICNSETRDKESFYRIAKFYNVDGEILEAEQKMYASFRRVRGLGYMTASEMLGGAGGGGGQCSRMIYSIYFQSLLR